ncbi:MAG: hypothetical protein IKW21_02445 [Lachnospiraceae bacterium]|nr:hypothetical protein [Lachnospiraceae bacterium]
MGNNKNPFFNESGCPDPTAYYGTKNVIKEEAEMENKVHSLIHIFKEIAKLAGFDITNRVHFRHKKSRKEFK